jgi:RND family efflux transporter MFP subunit
MALPVSYTEALAFDIRESLVMSGSVDSYQTSIVASSIAGVVVELRARDGQWVKRGSTIARLRAETFELQLRAAEGELAEAEARMRLAEGRKERAARMWDERVISRQELDDANTEVEANAGRVAQLLADVARYRDEVERTRVRAPFDGVVVNEHTAVGEWLSPGSPVVELVDVGDLEVTLEVPERFFGGLVAGESVDVVFPALPGVTVAGKVRSVVPKADAQSRTFPVKVAISNDQGKLGVGMLANVRLPIGEAESAVLVPKDGLVSQGPRRFVFVIGADDTVASVDVTTGKSQGVWISVRGEVEPGARVVTQGNERLAPGTKVDASLKEFPKP